jgi:hypothetical protein
LSKDVAHGFTEVLNAASSCQRSTEVQIHAKWT